MNPNRASKSEVRKQSKAAKKWAQKNGGKVDPHAWRLVCPKASR